MNEGEGRRPGLGVQRVDALTEHRGIIFELNRRPERLLLSSYFRSEDRVIQIALHSKFASYHPYSSSQPRKPPEALELGLVDTVG